jgi:selenocysteine-specific elongation factor
VHGATVDEAHAGQRTALNLQRIELADIERGMVITVPGVFSPSPTFDVRLELLSTSGPLPSRKRIRFHVGTTELIGHAVLLGQDVLEPGQHAFARVRLEKPAFALPEDRFIIRQYSPMTTLGGGAILDAHPPRLRRSDPRIISRLRVLADGTLAERIDLLIEESESAGLDEMAIVGRLGITADAARREIQALSTAGRIRVLNEQPAVAASRELFDKAAEAAEAEVNAFHAAEPLLPGISREDLRARAFPRASAAFFRAVLDDLAARRRIVIQDDVVRSFGHSTTLAGADQKVRDQLIARFRDLGLQAPPPDEIAAGAGVDRAAARKIIQMLVREQVLVRINDALILDRAAVEKLIADVRARKRTSSNLGVGEFKELTGLSRKYAVPLLEYLDGQRVTRRLGDSRVIL